MQELAILPPVSWLQNSAEFEDLLDYFRAINPWRVLEIGSFYGGTLWQWINNLPPNALIISVDVLIPPDDKRNQEVRYARSLWQGWADERGVELVCVGTNSIEAATVEAVRAYAPFDFIFIDGGHEYQTVSADFDNYFPMLAVGGLVAIHDISERREPDVRRFWNNLKRRKGLYIHEIIHTPGTWGIGVVQR